MIRKLVRSFLTSLKRHAGQSDYTRWSRPENLSERWNDRTRRIAALVPPGSIVIEFGAGGLILKQHLPENCRYTPSDIVDRGEGTVVCDLNRRPLPGFTGYDTAVFSGVLEYLHDVPGVIAHLAGCSVARIIASYAPSDIKKNRRAQGWVNDYSAEQFIKIFAAAGFQCIQSTPWKSQIICVFETVKPPVSGKGAGQ